MVIDNLFPCDIGAFVTIQEAIMRIRTIGLISTLALGLLAASLPTEAQQTGKVYRIGYLGIGSPGSLCGLKLKPTPAHIALWQRLRELGYEIVKEYRNTASPNALRLFCGWLGQRANIRKERRAI